MGAGGEWTEHREQIPAEICTERTQNTFQQSFKVSIL